MRGSIPFVVATAVAIVFAHASHGDPPLAQPTPCPCAADGVCNPKYDTWGYYQPKWRQWPLDTRPEIPGPLDEEVEVELPRELQDERLTIPPPEEEDSRAPISRQDREAAEVERIGQEPQLEGGVPIPPNGLDMPPMDFPLEPLPGQDLPGLGEPPGEGLDRGLDFDPPPGLPFNGGGRPGGPGASLPNSGSHPLASQQSNRHDVDLPPVPPRSLIDNVSRRSHAGNVGTTSAVQRLPAVSTQPGHGTGRRFDSQVRPASANMPASSPKHVIGRAVFSAPR